MRSLEGPKRDIQVVVIVLLVGMPISIIGFNIYVTGFESEFIQGTVVPASWAVLLIAMDAAFRQLDLGNKPRDVPTSPTEKQNNFSGPPL